MEQGSGLRSGISHMSSVIDDGITVNLILVDLNGNSSSVVEPLFTRTCLQELWSTDECPSS
jgi:hypothetical protein